MVTVVMSAHHTLFYYNLHSKYITKYKVQLLVNMVGVGISLLSIVTGYGLDGPSLIPGRVKFFSSPQHPDRLWGPPSLLSNGYQGFFTGGKVAGA
jgi:hypothetical protein